MAKKNKSDWKPSENILKYLKSWEKFRAKPYDDGEGNITVGYGFNLPTLLKKYKKGITEEQADKEFAGVVNTFVPEFRRLTPNFDSLNNNQRDALFSLYYNAGADTYMKSPMLFKYLKEGDFDKAVKEINHDEWKDDMDGQKKRRAFERRVFSTPTDQPWTVDDDSNYVLIEDKPVEDESIEKGTNDSKYEDARHVEAKYGDTGYIGRGYDGKKVRISDSNIKSVGISNNADPDKWYESVNPILDTDPISLIADFIPTVKRMLDPNRERSGEDTATDFEEKMWKAYTDGDISRLPASKYRFDDDDDDAQYVGLPQEQAILIQSLLDKEYMNNMLDEAYKDADEKDKRKIRDYKKVLDKLNKNIFENPGKWILVNEGISPFREEVYGDDFEKVNETSGLGALKNFSVRWDPDAGMLDVKDDYDFSRKKIAEDIIPERDVPLRIRERIKYDPKKGSVLRNNDKALPKRFVRKYEEGGEAKYEYVASRDNTSVGSSGINENANYGTIPVDGVDINEIVVGGVPVVGDIMDVKDAYDSFIDRDALGMVMAAMGLIPFVGGISKKAMQAKRATKKLSQRDKELLGSLPEYAKPASPIGEAWENHKKRLFSGAYERLTGERLRMKNGEPDPDMLDTNIYDWDDPKVFRDAKYFLGDEYSDDEIREIIDEISGYGVLNGNIIRSKNVDEFIDLFLEGNPNISNKDVENFVKSHEVEHKIHYPDSGADKNGFDLNKIDDDEVKDYFKEDHFTEMAARGTQIKNYFGLTDDAQEVTPEMLEYAARNYLKDYGYDNEMKEYFESISDYKKAAKWITDHASVGLGAYYVGDRIADPKKEKKRNGGKLTPYKAGFRFIDHKKEYGDPKDASHRFPGRKFMYFYENDKPSKSIVFAEEGGVIGKQREAYDYFTNKRGMSKIQALAIIGNLMAESGLKDDIYGDNRTSYGIQQWHNERMDKLFKHAKKKGHSTPTFKDQLEFLADEYEGKTGYSNFLYTRKGKEGPGYYNYSRQDFMNANNLKDAVVAWNQGAGRPHKSVIRNDDRYDYAMEVAKNLGLEIEENSVSLYGQMGFGDDGEIAASVTLPEVEVAAALPNPEAQSQERQSEEERFRTWTETYGKDIVNHLLTLDGKKDGDDSDYSMMYRQNQKESEEDKKMALINAVLPNIQLRIKGVTDN